MGLFQKFKHGLHKSQTKLLHDIRRIVTLSPKLTGATLEELEAALLGADLGTAMTRQIVAAVKKAYETQGRSGLEIFAIAEREVQSSLAAGQPELRRQPDGLTVVSIVGVNGTGKTTTAAKLAHLLQSGGQSVLLGAGSYHADPAAVAHDAVVAAQARHADYLLVDTAGRLHTKHNLMQELQKLHRVMGKKLPGAPHEVLLVLDGSTGMNALNQAREFHKAVKLTGLVITKLDGTSKGGMVVAIQKELGLPVKFIGVGEQPDDLQPFDAKPFAEALFSVKE